MRSLSVSSLGLVVVAAVTLATSARADDKQACSSAYDKTQSLRRTGHLGEARAQALVCVRDACPDFIRGDCTKWLGEIDANMPTVVFEVKDANGNDATAVKVTLDGKPWVEKVDGNALAIDPGAHVLRLELAGAPAKEEAVAIRQGEKNRKLAYSFQVAAATPPAVGPLASAAPTGDATATSDGPKASVAPWVVGGIGVAGLILGGVFGGLTLAAKSTVNNECNASGKCSQDGLDAASRGKTFGPVSTMGLIVGGVGIAGSIVLFATRKSGASEAPPTRTVGMGPAVTPRAAQWRFEGSF